MQRGMIKPTKIPAMFLVLLCFAIGSFYAPRKEHNRTTEVVKSAVPAQNHPQNALQERPVRCGVGVGVGGGGGRRARSYVALVWFVY